jgi:hypothetical protein
MLQKVIKQNEPVVGETPSGVINGTNLLFTTQAPFVVETLSVFLNGIKQRIGVSNDYTIINDQTFAMNFAPITLDVLEVNYYKK